MNISMAKWFLAACFVASLATAAAAGLSALTDCATNTVTIPLGQRCGGDGSGCCQAGNIGNLQNQFPQCFNPIPSLKPRYCTKDGTPWDCKKFSVPKDTICACQLQGGCIVISMANFNNIKHNGVDGYKSEFCPETAFAGGDKSKIACQSKGPASTPPSTPGSNTKPTSKPTQPTQQPIMQPTNAPTSVPTNAPTAAHTKQPTIAPTQQPTIAPTKQPTIAPTMQPTVAPTMRPTIAPTMQPTVAPTMRPTIAPTMQPTVAPTRQPTSAPPSQLPYGLTTRDTMITSTSGQEIKLRGVAWYGFNTGSYGNFLGLYGGGDSINRDVRTHLWRMKQLGFNSIRLPFSFNTFSSGVSVRPSGCTVTPTSQVIASVLEPGSSSKQPFSAPPNISGGVCNAGMPTDSVRSQYVWVVKMAAQMGLYVTVDFHSNSKGDQTFYSMSDFKSKWQDLIRLIVSDKTSANQLILEPVNEPDGYDCNWTKCQSWGTLTNFYQQMISILLPLAPNSIILVEGGGQASGWSNWGDGFTTNSTAIAAIKKIQGNIFYADATPFFQAIHNAAYRNQIVLSPHVYCPRVTGATDHFSGSGLYERLNWSFGDKQKNGFTFQGTTKKYAVMNGEFGTTLGDNNERACISSIFSYMNNQQPSAYSHPPITSWNFWTWNADSADTGGLLSQDGRSITWSQLDLLTQNLGLTPFYK